MINYKYKYEKYKKKYINKTGGGIKNFEILDSNQYLIETKEIEEGTRKPKILFYNGPLFILFEYIISYEEWFEAMEIAFKTNLQDCFTKIKKVKINDEKYVAMEFVRFEYINLEYLNELSKKGKGALGLFTLAKYIENNKNKTNDILDILDYSSFQRLMLLFVLIGHNDIAARNIMLYVENSKNKFKMIDYEGILKFGLSPFAIEILTTTSHLISLIKEKTSKLDIKLYTFLKNLDITELSKCITDKENKNRFINCIRFFIDNLNENDNIYKYILNYFNIFKDSYTYDVLFPDIEVKKIGNAIFKKYLSENNITNETLLSIDFNKNIIKYIDDKFIPAYKDQNIIKQCRNIMNKIEEEYKENNDSYILEDKDYEELEKNNKYFKNKICVKDHTKIKTELINEYLLEKYNFTYAFYKKIKIYIENLSLLFMYNKNIIKKYNLL